MSKSCGRSAKKNPKKKKKSTKGDPRLQRLKTTKGKP